MCPTEEDLREFIQTYLPYSGKRTLLLTGGGDPLYDFEHNRDKILMILRVCEELGIEVVIQSGELDTINTYYNSLFKNVIAYYFSSEAMNDSVRALAKKLQDAGKRVVVSKVLNVSKDVTAIDYGALDR